MAIVSPNYRVTEVERNRDKLFLALVEDVADVRLSLSELAILVSNAHNIWPKISEDTWFESLRFLANQTLTPEQLKLLCWRVAANLSVMVTGRPMPLQTFVAADDQHCVSQILAGQTANHPRTNKPGVTFEVLVLTGWAATITVSQFLPKAVLGPLSRRLGFSAPWGDRPYTAWPELIGLRMAAQLRYNRMEDGLVLGEFADHATTAKWNTDKVLNLRFRLKNEKCPNEFRHPCRNCAIGYDQCRAGTHPLTYELGTCIICADGTVMDPYRSKTICVNCLESKTQSNANSNSVQKT